MNACSIWSGIVDEYLINSISNILPVYVVAQQKSKFAKRLIGERKRLLSFNQLPASTARAQSSESFVQSATKRSKAVTLNFEDPEFSSSSVQPVDSENGVDRSSHDVGTVLVEPHTVESERMAPHSAENLCGKESEPKAPGPGECNSSNQASNACDAPVARYCIQRNFET